MQEPTPDNDFQAAHVALLQRSFRQYLGRDLHSKGAARAIYDAPFPVLSHNTAADPVLTYGNLAAQRLWEMNWATLTTMPSRLTAEPQHRDTRAAMFDRMRQQGFIDDYTGVRISASGRRFEIQNAVIWSLADADGVKQGEAATFHEFEYL